MKELITQYTGKGFNIRDEYLETASNEYKINELVKVKTFHVGAKKEPSVEQNGLMHACFKLVADNTERFQNLEQVKFAFKVDIHFVHEDRVHVDKKGMVHFEYRSFGFAELGHMERCNVFERGFDWCASVLSITKEQLIKEAKSRMHHV
jgi:hypothetical protein